MLQPGQYDGGARQEFAAAPRVVNQHKKYKDPYGTDGEYIPQNIMHDRRIVRGSTHAAMVIPGGAHPETLLFQREKKKQAKKPYMGSQQMPVRRIVRTPEPPQGRHNIDIQTQQFVESLTDKPPEYETGCQTDFYIDRPPTPILMPEREGVENVGTQIQDGEHELFDFNEEVQPILNVLCTKTQEQARMEVLEEQEMRIMKEQQREFEQLRDKQLAEAQRLEQEELRRRQEQDRRIQQMRARKEQRINMHQKLVSRALAKKLLQNLKLKTQSLLLGQGFFRPTLETKLNTVIFPYIFGKVKEYVDDDFGKDAFFDEMMLHAIRGIQDAHGNVVKNANQRKRELKENRIRQAEQKALAKKKRQEERERLRKEAAMLELKNKLDAEFVQKGQTKEGVLKQRMLSSNGNFQNTPAVGLLGGVLFQFYMALQGFCSNKPQILNRLQEDREVVFKLFYDWLRSEQHIPVELFKPTKAIAEFVQANQFGEELTQEQKQSLFPLYFSDQTDPLLSHVRESSEQYNINPMLLNSVLQGAYLLSLQPADTKQELFAVARERISESELPEQFNPTPPFAIVRIKVPLSRPQPDQANNESQVLDASGAEDPNATTEANSPGAPAAATADEPQKEAQKQVAKEEDSKAQQQQQEQKAADQTFAQISDIKDQVLLINPQNIQTGAATHVLHQYAQRLVRLNVLKFLVATFAEQLEEGETAQQIAEEVEAQEKSLQKRLLANLQDTLPSFDFEIN